MNQLYKRVELLVPLLNCQGGERWWRLTLITNNQQFSQSRLHNRTFIKPLKWQGSGCICVCWLGEVEPTSWGTQVLWSAPSQTVTIHLSSSCLSPCFVINLIVSIECSIFLNSESHSSKLSKPGQGNNYENINCVAKSDTKAGYPGNRWLWLAPEMRQSCKAEPLNLSGLMPTLVS